ncbi:WavQ [Pectobacterium cacticida]|uniref:WavQ n=1 Tax=Pectobacterium cacticida TaxID=69221 RepID=UPI002FF25A80
MIIFIYAPSYDVNNGGAIVLHRLCHVINNIKGFQAYLVKYSTKKRRMGFIRNAFKLRCVNDKKDKYKINENWNTPVWDKYTYPKNSVVIYPEIVNNNPLKIKNVVRWLLHQPGFHTNKIEYLPGELYFKFNSAIDDFDFPGSTLSQNELKVIYYPIDIYNNSGKDEMKRDIHSCHMVRKGKDKKFVHDENSVSIDGLSHEEVASIFRRSKRFICYDDYTAYSIFAVLCGCESVVIPDEKKTIDEWYPNITDRYGIAYGLSESQRQWALETRHKVLEHIINEHEKCEHNVQICLKEIKEYFNTD